MASPCGPDALSASTAETAKDAPRPSMNLSPPSVQAHEHKHKHIYAERRSPQSITPPPLHHLLAFLYSSSFSLHIFSFPVNREKDSGEGEGMKCVSCGMTFDPCKTDALSSLESSSLFLNLSFSFLSKRPNV